MARQVAQQGDGGGGEARGVPRAPSRAKQLANLQSSLRLLSETATRGAGQGDGGECGREHQRCSQALIQDEVVSFAVAKMRRPKLQSPQLFNQQHQPTPTPMRAPGMTPTSPTSPHPHDDAPASSWTPSARDGSPSLAASEHRASPVLTGAWASGGSVSPMLRANATRPRRASRLLDSPLLGLQFQQYRTASVESAGSETSLASYSSGSFDGLLLSNISLALSKGGSSDVPRAVQRTSSALVQSVGDPQAKILLGLERLSSDPRHDRAFDRSSDSGRPQS